MKILMPSNLTKSSQASTDFAVSFFGAGADYVLLNSYPLVYRSGFHDSFRQYMPEFDEVPMDKLKREKKRLINTFGHLNMELKALYGDPAQDIRRISEKENIDLIVLGYSNFKRWKDGLSYRNRYPFVEFSHPILLVPEGCEQNQTKCLYYVTDFSNHSDSTSSRFIRTIAQLSEADIKLFCFEKVDDENSIKKWMLDKELAGLNRSFEVIPSIKKGLISLLKELDNKENALVVFDFETDENALFGTVEHYMNKQRNVKPLLLMPKDTENNLLRGA